MNGIISSRDGQSAGDRRDTQGSRRGRANGRRRPRRLGYEPLESRRLLSITPTPPVAEFPLRASGGTPEGAAEDGSGNLWVLLSNQNIAEISNGGGVLAEYHVPTYNGLGGAPVGSELGLVTYDAKDNGIWFYESTSNVFGMLNLANDTIAEYPALFFSSDPRIVQITAGPDGNIWFTEPDLNEVGLFDTSTDIISQFTMPLPDTQPQGITVGADGNLWFTEGGLNQLGSLNPYTHVLNQYPYEPSSYTNNDQGEGITAGPNGTLWFVETQNNVIKGFTLPDQANNFQGAFMANLPPAYPSTGNPPNPLPSANLWSIGEESDGNIYYTEPGSSYNSVGIVFLDGDPNGYYDYIQTVSPQPATNFTNALVVPATTGTKFITEPGAGQLLTIGVPATKTTPSSGFPPAALPSIIPSNDANDVITVGNDLWYTDTTDINGEIVEFDPSTQLNTIYQLPEFPPPPPSGPPNPLPPQDPDQMTLVTATNDQGQLIDYIWFTEEAVNAIGYLSVNTVTGATSWYQTALTAVSSQPTAIAWDPIESEFWMTEPASNQIINFNPTTAGSAKAPITIPDPVGVLVDPNNGYLWITEGGTNDKIVEYSPINEKILYTFSTTGSPANLIWGPDGNIWFTEANGSSGLIGILTPPDPTAGTPGSLTEEPVSGPANSIAVGPSNYPDSLWFTETNSNQVGEITYSGQGAAEMFAVQGYVTAPDSNANAIALGPDGNEWFTSGPGTPADMGAVVLNPADLGAKVAVITQPTNVEETIFGGFSWGFGVIVAVENSAGEIDPFVQGGDFTLTLDNNPTGDKLDNTLTSLTAPLADGEAVFGGITMDKPAIGYTLEATYSLQLPNSDTVVTAAFDVAGPAKTLVVTTEPPLPPSSVQAGVAFGLTVSAEDFEGVVVPSFDDPISISISTNPPGITGVLNGSTVEGALYGVANFSGLTIDQSGNGYVIQAADLSPNTTVADGDTKPFDVTPGPATQLVFVAPGKTDGDPVSTAVAGTDFANPSNVVVYAEDQFGSVATSYNGPVTIELANGATGLTGTLTVTAKNGVATFTNLEIDYVGTYELVGTSGNLSPSLTPSPSSTTITITPAAPAQFAWVTQPPTKVTEGIPFGGSLDIEDQYGNLETSDNQNVSALLDLNGTAEPGDLAGTTQVAASNGVVTFTNLIINALSPSSPIEYFHITASTGAGGFDSDASTGIDVVPPQLVVTSQPTVPVTAGVSFALTVQAQTYLGTVDTSAAGTDTLSILSGPTGATISSGGTAADTNGVATFTGVVLDTAGTYVLKVSNGNYLPGDTQTIVIDAGTPTGLVFLQAPPKSVVAGAPFGFEVAGAADQFGNPATLTGSVTVAIGLNPGGSTLGGTLTVTANGGVADFSGLTLNKVGDPYTLVVTSGSFPSITTGDIQVIPADASQLVVATGGEPQSPVTAGVPFSWTLDALDPFGNLDTNFDGQITVTQPGIITGTPAVSASGGVVQFNNLQIDKVGTYTLTATGTSEDSQPLTSVTSTSVTVVPAAPTQLVWTTEPPSQVLDGVGLTPSPVVEVEDDFNNQETSYNGDVTVTLEGGPAGASLGGTTAIPASSGIATFPGLTISPVGSGYTLVATTVVPTNHTLTAQSSPIQVLPDPAASLKLSTTLPSSETVNQPFELDVTALDQGGNPDQDFTGVISVQLASGTNTLGGPMTATAVDGVAKFKNLTLADVGSVTLQFSSPNLPTITTGSINVVAGTATQLVVITEPQSSVTAGAPIDFEVEAEDKYGNLATGFSGTLTAALSGGVKLFGSLSVQASGGIAQFNNLSVDQAGTGYTMTITGDGVSSTTTKPSFSVTAAAAAQLVFPTQPASSVTAGQGFPLAVEVEDAYGNPVTDYADSISIALTHDQVTTAVSGVPSEVPVGGLAEFTGIAEDSAGSDYAVVATSPGLSAAISDPIAVTPATATQLVVTVPAPTSMPAGSAFGIQVSAEDPYGNVVPGFNGQIAIALSNNPGNATLLGGPFVMTTTAGNANFSPHLIIDTAASGYTLTATSTGLTPVTSPSIAVTADAATHLAVRTQPPSTLASSSTAFGFVVAAEDPYGNVVPSFGGAVQATTPVGSGASLGGTTTVTAGAGLATFAGLTLSGASSPVPLLIGSAGLTGTTTSPVSLTNAVPAQVQFNSSSLVVDENDGTATFQIVRSGATGSAVSVTVATSGGTAVAGVNYAAIDQTVNFAPGQTTQTVAVPLDNPGPLAQPVTVNLVMSNPSAGAVLGSQPSATLTILNAGASTQPTTKVTLESVQVVKNKRRQVKEVLLTFGGTLDATAANSLADYELIKAGKKGSFTAKNARAIKVRTVLYNAANDTVALTPKRAFVLTKAVEVVANGTTAVLKGKAVTITSAAVDVLLQNDEVAALTRARKS